MDALVEPPDGPDFVHTFRSALLRNGSGSRSFFFFFFILAADSSILIVFFFFPPGRAQLNRHLPLFPVNLGAHSRQAASVSIDPCANDNEKKISSELLESTIEWSLLPSSTSRRKAGCSSKSDIWRCISATSQGPPALKRKYILRHFINFSFLNKKKSSYAGTRRSNSNTAVPFQCWATWSSSSVTATTCRNFTDPRAPCTEGRRISSARSMCCSRHSKSDPSSGQCQEMWSPAKKALPVWNTKIINNK